MSLPLMMIFASAFLHATWNFCLKLARGPHDILVLSVYSWGLSGLVVAVAGPVWPTNTAGWWWAVSSGFFEGLYFIALARAFETGQLGITYVWMRGAAMALVWLVSASFLEEKFSITALVGGVGLTVGLWLMATSPGDRPRRASLAWATLASVCITGYHVCYGQGMRLGTGAATLFFISMTITTPLLWLTTPRRQRPSLERYREPALIVGGAACFVSFWMFLAGLAEIGPGLAIAVRNTSIGFALLYALALGESIGAARWVGAALIFVGAAMTALDF
jgi:drug/metabolite transporter (DMT)-like permease